MTCEVILIPAAEDDLEDAASFYESRQTGLGIRFVANVRATLEQLAKYPAVHAEFYQDVRKTLVESFPYSILYVLLGTTIDVISIFHASRNPREWKKRLK